jgi:hypothetical protein
MGKWLYYTLAMNIKLKNQLLLLQKNDQAMRSSDTWDETVDLKNTNKLKKIIEKYGWPDEALVGKEGCEAAWLIAQHADHDIAFQTSCLSLMKTKKKTIPHVQIAYLTDRIHVNKGEKQIYGTQFYFDKKKNKLLPRPISEKPKLEARRKRIGLEPFLTYTKRLQEKNKQLKKKSI